MNAAVSYESPLRRAALVVFPWRGLDRASGMTWVLHLLLWGALFAALWQLNRWGGMERWLRSPWPILHRVWLPLVAGSIYLLGVLSAALWHALRRSTEAGGTRDIEATWNEAQHFLDRTCFSAKDLPLYLILGPLSRELTAWLESAGAASVLPRSATPLHVFANDHAIFVICDTASLLGVNAAKISSPVSEQGTLARLRHLCRLLRRERPAERALQGIVLTFPFASLQADGTLQHAIACCQDDLGVIRDATGLECPLYVAFTGLNGAPEIAAEGWLQRFPLAADQEPEESAALLADSVDRMCARLLPQLVRRHMKIDLSSAASSTMTDILRDNVRQYRFLTSARVWRTRLLRLLTLGTCNSFHEPGQIAGCYFLPDANGGNPVFEALLTDLLTHQGAITWTPETLAAVRREERLTQSGYGLVLAGWLGMLLAAGWYASRN